MIDFFKKFANGIKSYLSDWRNLLGHALFGIILLIIAIWLPVNIWIKLLAIACLVAFNIWRMRKNK